MDTMQSQRDWTQGSITRNLLTLSWPMVVTEGLYMLGISIDMIWVGRVLVRNVLKDSESFRR